jgi:hypothetical protein
MVVVDDPASLVASRGGDRRDPAVSAVAEHDTTIDQVSHLYGGPR